MSEIVQFDRRLSVSCALPIFVRRRVVESKRGTKVAPEWPQLFCCTLSRLRHRCLLLDKFWSDEQEASIEIAATHGRTLTEVKLDSGEEVCVSIRHLVGFSQTVRLSSVIDLCVAAWAIDKGIIQLATGPGRLIFECQGVPRVWGDSDTVEHQRVDCDRLVMWPKRITYSLDRVHSGTALYFSPFRLFLERDNPGELVILDNESVETHRLPLWDVIKKAYLPW